MLNVAVLGGGTSSEREVSLKSSQKVFENLDEKKYNKEYFDFPADLEKFLQNYKKFDVVMPVFHGVGGEDGTVQGFLKTLGLKFTFSDIEALAVAMNKNFTKKILADTGIKFAKSVIFNHKNISKENILKNFNYPLVIKLNEGGSSLGTYIIKDEKNLDESLPKIREFEMDIMIEEFIKGKEETAPALGNQNAEALPVLEIRPKTEFFDYKAKYDPKFCDEICPAPIDDELAKELQRQAVLVHKTLGCKGISRSDFIVTEDNQIYFLEVNTIPGLTDASLVPQSAKKAGYSYPEFLDKLIELTFK